jgi:predicted HicB family RNase H-like nuclease
MKRKEIRMSKQEEVHRLARTLFAQTPDWVTFYREVLGLNGVVRHSFPTLDSLQQFKQTEAYQDIQRMLRRLRQLSHPSGNGADKTRVITVRLPQCLHDALREEAYEHHTSMNKLCISKLLQMIDNQATPSEAEA